MNEYITKNEAADAAIEASSYLGFEPIDEIEAAIKSVLATYPAADVRPVVRCGECRYAYDSVGGWCCSHGVCVDCIVREDFFCADGARMDGDGDV